MEKESVLIVTFAFEKFGRRSVIRVILQHFYFVSFLVDWVKGRVSHLRNKYTKAKNALKSGSAYKSNKKNSWLIEKMQFLAPYVATRPSTSNMEVRILECFLYCA